MFIAGLELLAASEVVVFIVMEVVFIVMDRDGDMDGRQVCLLGWVPIDFLDIQGRDPLAWSQVATPLP